MEKAHTERSMHRLREAGVVLGARLDTRMRQVAHDLTLALLDAWQRLKKG